MAVIQYKFADGHTKGIEVTEEFARQYAELEHKDALTERKKTRRHQSLDKSMEHGFDVPDSYADTGVREEQPTNILQPNERRMAKKELFNELYQRYLYLKKNERREKLIAALRPYFKTEIAVKNYVDSNIERKRRNLIMRRIRLTRKVNLQNFNFFVTFTFNGELHTEETFRKGLKKRSQILPRGRAGSTSAYGNGPRRSNDFIFTGCSTFPRDQCRDLS